MSNRCGILHLLPLLLVQLLVANPVATSLLNKLKLDNTADLKALKDQDSTTLTRQGAASCSSQVLTADSGNISVGSASTNYQNSLNCEWQILLSPGRIVNITWNTIDLESSPTCSYDYVQIQDLNASGEMIGSFKYCGTTLPPVFTSSSNQVLVKFRTDSSVTGRGFSLLYDSVFTGNGASTIVVSTTHPTTTLGVIETTTDLPALTTTTTTHPTSTTAHLTTSTVHLTPTTDRPTTTTAYLATTTAYLTTTSDSLNSSPFCSGSQLLTADSGIISVWTGNADYQNNQNCTWQIQVGPGRTLNITWVLIDLEYSISCRFDYVQIQDLFASGEVKRSFKYCGQALPAVFTSTSNLVTVRFVTDGSVTGRGFSLLYSSAFTHNYTSTSTTPRWIEPTASPPYCNAMNELSTPRGSISVGSAGEHYWSYQECEWRLFTPPGTVIRIAWLTFDLEQGVSCGYDYVEVLEISYVSSKIRGKYCGSSLPSPLIISSNVAVIRFHSDGYVTGQGFTLLYDSIPSPVPVGNNMIPA